MSKLEALSGGERVSLRRWKRRFFYKCSWPTLSPSWLHLSNYRMCLVAGIFSVPGFCRVYLYRVVYHQESLQWQGLRCVWDHVYVCFLDSWVGQGSQGLTCLVSSKPRVRDMFSLEPLTVTRHWVNLGHKALLISNRRIMTCKYG